MVCCPEGAEGFSPGVSTPGTYRPKRRALKGRKIEHGVILAPS
jgi:hypothetical protein